MSRISTPPVWADATAQPCLSAVTRPDPDSAAPSPADLNRTELDRTEPDSAAPSPAELNRTELDRAEPDSAAPSTAELDRAEPDRADLDRAAPSPAERNRTELDSAAPGRAAAHEAHPYEAHPHEAHPHEAAPQGPDLTAVTRAPTYTATGLPAGLSISSDGVISGSMTELGTNTVTIISTEDGDLPRSVSFDWVVL